jgi:hypothetical protein
MLNCYCTSGEVNVIDGNSQGFRNAASKMKQYPNQEPISEVVGGFFKQTYLMRLQIGVSHNPFPFLKDGKEVDLVVRDFGLTFFSGERWQ